MGDTTPLTLSSDSGERLKRRNESAPIFSAMASLGITERALAWLLDISPDSAARLTSGLRSMSHEEAIVLLVFLAQVADRAERHIENACGSRKRILQAHVNRVFAQLEWHLQKIEAEASATDFENARKRVTTKVAAIGELESILDEEKRTTN